MVRGWSGEVRLACYELLSSTEVLGRIDVKGMLAGLSARRNVHGFEPLGERARVASVPSTPSQADGRGSVRSHELYYGYRAW